jgi:3-deoxy-D-manno-octulosonic-acid transferase
MIGTLFLFVWRIAGVLAIPVLALSPTGRKHMWKAPVPTPGRTWVHGASMGEHRIAEALLPYLGPVWQTHSSWRTDTPGTFPAPLDLPGIIGPWLDRARPGRLVLLEGELWPGWLAACAARGIPVVVVSARKGAGWKRWQRVGPLFRSLTREVRFLHADEWGDLKRSAPVPTAPFTVPRITIIAASTRPGDEERVVAAWKYLPEPRPLLLLAPRHLNRVDAITRKLDGHRISHRSTGLNDDADIWMLDTQGELAGLMTQAHIVFIGGTFDPSIGGHSPAEAAAGGAHIVHGPHTQANPAAWKQLTTTMVQTETELGDTFATLLSTERRTPRPPSAVDPALIQALPPVVAVPEGHGAIGLWPLVPLWHCMSTLHRWLQRGEHPTRFVVVGGLVNGGVGRTPAAAWLAEQLSQASVLSEGYRRNESGTDIRLGQPTAPATMRLGDELEMIRRRGISVVSAPNRIDGLRHVDPDSTAIIDGGLGDPRLKNGYRIACIDGLTPRGRGPFPAGKRRLSWSTLREVDAIWISNCADDQQVKDLPEGIPTIRSRMRPVGWLHKGHIHPLKTVSGPIDVVVGIADPERFVCSLLDLNLTVRSVKTVRDHGALGSVAAGTILTEKDAARLPIDADVWALRMELEVQGAEPVLQGIREHCA